MKDVTVKRVDKLGRIVLPMEYRENMGIEPGTKVMLCSEDDKIIIQLESPQCKVCGSTDHVDDAIPLCRKCLAKAKNLEI